MIGGLVGLTGGAAAAGMGAIFGTGAAASTSVLATVSTQAIVGMTSDAASQLIEIATDTTGQKTFANSFSFKRLATATVLSAAMGGARGLSEQLQTRR